MWIAPNRSRSIKTSGPPLNTSGLILSLWIFRDLGWLRHSIILFSQTIGGGCGVLYLGIHDDKLRLFSANEKLILTPDEELELIKDHMRLLGIDPVQIINP